MSLYQIRRTLCREGVYYALMLAALFSWAILINANLLVLVAGLLCAPLLLNVWMCKRALQGVEVSRSAVRSVVAGQTLTVDIHLNNRGRRARWGLTVQDRLAAASEQPAGSGLQPRLFLASLTAGRRQRLSYRTILPGRGRYRFGPLRLSSRFPFGLISAKRTIEDQCMLTVYPRIGHLSPAWQRRYCPVPQGTLGSRRAGRAPGDFFAVREWQAGDSSRWVHWRRSARQGQLIVRQFEQPSDRRLILLVDLWQPEHPSSADLERVELVVSFAATVVADLCQRPGFHLRLVLTGNPPQQITGPANGALMTAALEHLAVARAGEQSDVAAVWQAVCEDLPGEVEVLVVSPRAGTRWAEAWHDTAPQSVAGRWQMIGPQESRFSEYFKAL
jgi:uncharacterized protein (DUF58 family)